MPKSKTLEISTFFFIICCIFSFFSIKLYGQCTETKQEKVKCDFSQYKPLTLSDNKFLFESAVKKVEPVYSLAAKSVKAEGKVKVLLLINRQGEVVKACVFSGHPLLQASARTAALQWKFKKNFAFAEKQKRRYIQAVLPFNFQAEASKLNTLKP